MKHLSVLLVCTYILMSCKPAEKPSNEVIRNLNPTDEPIEGFPAYTKAEIIKMETTPACLMTEIKQVKINDSYIFALDFKNLYSFTREGKFIAQIGTKGDGPGEYLSLSTFYVDDEKQQVTIIDDFKNQLFTYDANGKHISTVSIPKSSFQWCNYAEITMDKKVLTYNMLSMNDTKTFSLFDLEKNEIAGHHFSYQPITVGNYAYATSWYPMSKSGEDINIIRPLCDTIYSYSTASSSFYPKYIIETPQKMAPKDKIRKNTPSYSDDVYKLAKEGYFPGFTGIFEIENKVLLEYKHEGIMLAYFLFDKALKTGNYYLNSHEVDTETLPFFATIYAYKNTFVARVAAESLLSLKNIKDKKMKTIIESLKEDDNPCLVLYKF